jgi:hypothetical protein
MSRGNKPGCSSGVVASGQFHSSPVCHVGVCGFFSIKYGTKFKQISLHQKVPKKNFLFLAKGQQEKIYKT